MEETNFIPVLATNIRCRAFKPLGCQHKALKIFTLFHCRILCHLFSKTLGQYQVLCSLSNYNFNEHAPFYDFFFFF